MNVSRRNSWPVWVVPVILLAPLWVFGQVKDVRSYHREVELRPLDSGYAVSAQYQEVFTPRLRQRLSNGFTSRILVDVVMREVKKKTPVAAGLLRLTILYDIWEESFHVRQESGAGRKDVHLRSMKELIALCGSLRQLALVPTRELKEGAKVRIEVRITVNPTSAELRSKVRRYLANPDGRGHIGSPRSFFGSFSRIFVNEKDMQADMVYTYRSPPMSLTTNPQAE